jgi:hypothetical protein
MRPLIRSVAASSVGDWACPGPGTHQDKPTTVSRHAIATTLRRIQTSYLFNGDLAGRKKCRDTIFGHRKIALQNVPYHCRNG